MKKKSIAILLVAVLLASLFLSCSLKKEESVQGVETFYQETAASNGPLSYEDFIDSGKTIAAQIGDVYPEVAQDFFKAKEVREYASVADMLESLRMGKVDAVLLSHGYVKQLQDSGMYPDFEYLWVPEDVYVNKAGPIFHTEELRDRYNEWFAKLAADGTWQEIVDRWIGAHLPAQEDIPQFEFTGENGILYVCDTGDYPPLIYFDANGEPAGFDVEMISRFAQHMGMKPEFTMIAYDAVVPYVASGKAAMSACTLTITDDREENILFGEPSVITQAVLIVPKTDGASGSLAGFTTANYKNAPSYSDFAGKDIAAIVGATHYMTIEKIGGNPIYYNDSPEAAEEVRRGTVEGFMTILSNARVMASQLNGFEVIPVPKEVFNSQTGGISNDAAVIDRFNVFLASIKADGTFADMEARWFGDEIDLDAPMPKIDNSGKNGVLRVATSALSMPYVYYGENGELKGFSAELALRFGAYEEKKVEFAEMDFSALIPYIKSGKAEISLSSMSITEERKQSVLFTDPFHDEQHGILALKQDILTNNTSSLNYTNVSYTNAGSTGVSYTDFAGKRIGMRTGSIWDTIIEEHIDGTPAFYTEMSAGIEDIRKGRLDGFITDYSAAKVFAATEGKGQLISVEVPAEIFTAPMGAVSMDQDMIDRFNVFLAEIKADGTFADMHARWMEVIPDLDSPMPDIPLTNTNGILRVATSAEALPFAYVGENGELKGYSIELIRRFAAHEGMDIEFFNMEFGGMLPFIVSGKADFAIADITITDERKKSVLFTDSIYDDRAGIIMLDPDVSGATRDHTSLAGTNIGVLTGSFFDSVVAEKLDATPVYYQDDIAALEDVRKGRIGGVMYDYSIGLVIQNQPGNDVFDLITIPEELHSGPMGAFSADQEVIDRFDEFLAVIEADGTLEDMKRRWIEENPGSDPPMPDIQSTEENGKIKVALTGLLLPFSYSGADNELKGFCVELALRFGAYEGKTIEFVPMAFEGMIAYMISGKADIAIDSVAITEERKKSVLFTEPYYYDQVGVMVLKQASADAKTDGGSFMSWIKTGVERNLITDNRWKMIVDGLGVTMTIAGLAQIFGTAFGAFICWILMRKNRFVKWIGNLYCGLIYGTPIVVLLMITYYIIFGDANISNVLVAVAAFTMITGASVALNLKGAIETIDPVEIEAARSIGFSSFMAFCTVTLPQAVRRAMPSYTNGFVELVKATAIVGYIAIQDLTRAGDIIRSRTYDAYFPLLFVAIIYLIVTTICVQLFKLIIKKINGGEAN